MALSNFVEFKEDLSTDVVIIGAGPVGLFQIFELGLLGLEAHVIETLDQAGGQCSELYPQKPIYDIPALPIVGAQELTDRLLEQSAPFHPTYHFGHEVRKVEPLADDAEFNFFVQTHRGLSLRCRAVIIAGGNGAFQPTKLKVDDIDHLENESVFYQVKNTDDFVDQDLVVLGGGDSALDWALSLQPIANSVTLIHRSLKFRAQKASIDKMNALCDNFEMQFFTGQVVELLRDGDEKLEHIKVLGGDNVTRTLALDKLLVFFGQIPKLGPIGEWNLELFKNQIVVDTEKFQTSTPGIYAVGDINYYPGKKKLILSGFHEAALAAFAIKEQINPDKKVHLQYTTTSPIMHKRLGVEADKEPDAA